MINYAPVNICDEISKNIPSSVEVFLELKEPAATVTYANSKIPMTISKMPAQWWRNYFLPKNQIEKITVITHINPRIIKKMPASTIVKAINIKVELKKLQDAGIEIQKGLILVGFLLASSSYEVSIRSAENSSWVSLFASLLF
jgi:hypothetical protein